MQWTRSDLPRYYSLYFITIILLINFTEIKTISLINSGLVIMCEWRVLKFLKFVNSSVCWTESANFDQKIFHLLSKWNGKRRDPDISFIIYRTLIWSYPILYHFFKQNIYAIKMYITHNLNKIYFKFFYIYN